MGSASLRPVNAKERKNLLLSPALWLWLTAAVAVLAIFWEPLFSGLFIWGPDSSSFGHIQWRRALPAAYLGWWDSVRGLGSVGPGQPMVPHHLIQFLVPEPIIKAGLCIGTVLGSILAGIYWFRGCGIKGWPACLAALALGLTAHTFSLIAAGHDGKIEAMPFVILLLAAVCRAVTRRSLFHFALAGYAAGVAFSAQADMAMLFSFLASAYGLYLFSRAWPRRHDVISPATVHSPDHSGSTSQGLNRLRAKYVVRNLLGALLAAAILVGVSLAAVMSTLKVSLPAREAMVSASGNTDDARKNKWEFSTNWSLPPEDMLEFFAPCIYGIQTGDDRLPFVTSRKRAPYWGKLGRTLGWEMHHQGLMNLRQHTVYLGVIQLVFAAFAVVWALRRKADGGKSESARKPGPMQSDMSSSQPTVHRPQSSGLRPLTSDLSARRADIFFWAGVFLVSVLLALGRNFPLYRLFYMIPYAGDLRAPVKFLHLAEVSLCILLAFGLDAFLSGIAARQATAAVKPEQGKGKKGRPGSSPAGLPISPDRLWRFFGFACAGIGGVFLLGLVVVNSRETALIETWSSMGMASCSESLMRLMTGALVRAAVLFLVCAGAFLVAAYGSSNSIPRVLPAVLLVVLAIDLASVLKRYITVWDEYDRFSPSELIARLGSDKTNYRVALPGRGGLYEVWKNFSFPKRWITVLDSENFGALSTEDRAFYEALSSNPIRLWQLTSTRDVLGPASSLGPLAKSPEVGMATFFNVLNNGSVQWIAGGQGQHAWLRLKTVLPRAAIYPVEYAEGGSWTNRIADPAWNPARSVIVTGAGASHGRQGLCEPAEIVACKPNRVEVAARSDSGGVLMLNDRFDPQWEVFVDGEAAPLVRCNGIMRGVDVPTGEHRVVFRYRPAWPCFLTNLACALIILVWGGFGLLLRRRARPVAPDGGTSAIRARGAGASPSMGAG